MLSTIELVKHVCSVALERLLAVILGQATLDIQNFAHQVNDRVIEVENDHHSVSTSFSMTFVEIFRRLNLVEDTVVDATATDQRIQLQSQH